MSIDLVVGVYHGKGAFRASIKLNMKYTPGRNIAIIFRLECLQCNMENGDIWGGTFMEPMGYMIKNTSSGRFLGWAHECKTQFIVIPHGCALPPTRENKYAMQSYHVFLSLET